LILRWQGTYGGIRLLNVNILISKKMLILFFFGLGFWGT
jgi:hypothetical protein